MKWCGAESQKPFGLVDGGDVCSCGFRVAGRPGRVAKAFRLGGWWGLDDDTKAVVDELGRKSLSAWWTVGTVVDWLSLDSVPD